MPGQACRLLLLGEAWDSSPPGGFGAVFCLCIAGGTPSGSMCACGGSVLSVGVAVVWYWLVLRLRTELAGGASSLLLMLSVSPSPPRRFLFSQQFCFQKWLFFTVYQGLSETSQSPIKRVPLRKGDRCRKIQVHKIQSVQMHARQSWQSCKAIKHIKGTKEKERMASLPLPLVHQLGS